MLAMGDEPHSPEGPAVNPRQLSIATVAEELGRVSINGHTFSVSPAEHPEDRTARLARESRDAWVSLFKDVTTFVLIVAGVLFMVSFAYKEAFVDAAASPDAKRWALSVLSSVITGGISFVVGRKIGSSGK